jgi:hypothetical protein
MEYKHDVSETGSVFILRWRGEKTPTELGLLERANLSHWTTPVPCECGRSYTGETGRPVAVRLHEHKHNLQQGLLEKSKLAQHAYEKGHRVGWDDARILEIESNSSCRKYMESAHMACLTNPISQAISDISPIRIPHISNEVSHLQRRSIGVHKVSVSSVQVLLHRWGHW